MSRRRETITYGASPLLASKTPVWRSRLVLAVLALAFATLLGRAFYVQVLANDFFKRQGEIRAHRTQVLEPNRGRILDRNGLVLATSVPAFRVWAEEADAKHPKLSEVASLLGMSTDALRQRLVKSQQGYVAIKHQVDDAVGEKIRALKISGLYLDREYRREYPAGEAMAHVVGFTDLEGKGQEGIELALDAKLAGIKGSRRVIKDRMSRVIDDARDIIPPVNGEDVVLSIDSKIQFFAYDRLRESVTAHKAKSGSIIVLDARSGEILALANYPSYDPADRKSRAGDSMRNRAITDVFEPGSTVKPFIVAQALHTGRIKPETRIDTGNGKYQMGGFTITDTHPHGVVSVSQVIQVSSNIGAMKIGMDLPTEQMWQMYSDLGLGKKPDTLFPGAARGRLAAPSEWRPINKATMSYGYGLSASLFQLARAYTVFANDGRIIDTTLVKRQAGEAPAGQSVFSAAAMTDMRHMLGLVVSPEGTAPKAQMVGYSAGGKTGTARKVGDSGRYVDRKYRGFFVGIAPVESPRLVGAVMVDEPSSGVIYGGLLAAPVFSATIQQALRFMGVQPDQTIKPNIKAVGVKESIG